MTDFRDEFLSEDDLDLVSLSDEELDRWWDHWLRMAQATNEEDKNTYSHGVFVLLGSEDPVGDGSEDTSTEGKCT